jgi:N-hydroxyarylamine O-acetyltransferase
MDVEAYLGRIGYTGPCAPDRETLRALHRAHLLAVPFENLDIHLGREIVLQESRFFQKIVHERRGGFCYELNGLFGALLRDLGFRVAMLSAGVAREAGGFGPEFDHMALLVELEERWLADVGFGECFLEPLPLDRASGGEYRVARRGEEWTLLRGETPQYRFTLAPHVLADYREMCRYHQTSPDSDFTRGRVVSLATPDGRITLTDTRLIVTRQGQREERAIAGAAEFADLCRRYIGLKALKA